MDISDITQSLRLGSARRAGLAAAAQPKAERADAPAPDNAVRALDALRVELRTVLKAKFFAGFGQGTPAFDRFAPVASPGDVADETLNAAKQVADRDPGRAVPSLVAFRATVSETLDSVREVFRGRDDATDVDAVESVVNRGLDALADSRAQQAESTTRVLDIESKLRESSAIRIRTQEGDVVTIRLRNVETLDARDVAVERDGGIATRTTLDASRSQRVAFEIDGDINDAERAAIEDVFAQASDIADAFFDGDLPAAFENAAAFQFDAGQLQRVNFRFRVQEQQSVRFAEQRVGTAPEPQPVPTSDVPPRPVADLGPVINRPAPAAGPAPLQPAAPAQVDDAKVETPAFVGPKPVDDDVVTAAADAAPEPAAAPVVPEPAAAAVDTDALNGFFSLVQDFLRDTTAAFELAGDSTRFFYRESFKLTLLKETLVVRAPAEQTEPAVTAAGVVDKLVDATSTGAEEDTA